MLFSVIPQFRELVFFSSKMEKTKPALKWDISTAPCNRSQIKNLMSGKTRRSQQITKKQNSNAIATLFCGHISKNIDPDLNPLGLLLCLETWDLVIIMSYHNNTWKQCLNLVQEGLVLINFLVWGAIVSFSAREIIEGTSMGQVSLDKHSSLRSSIYN